MKRKCEEQFSFGDQRLDVAANPLRRMLTRRQSWPQGETLDSCRLKNRQWTALLHARLGNPGGSGGHFGDGPKKVCSNRIYIGS
jgi:hypothetical protein